MAADHQTSFVVFSLPRSRSAWLSLFLSYNGRSIGHDIGPDSRSVADFMARLGDGTCETGASFAWRLIRRLQPNVRFAVVLRDPLEVNESLERFGLRAYLTELQRRDDELRDIADQPGVMAVDYDALSSAAVCRNLFSHCLVEEMPQAWFDRFDPINIQVDMRRQVEKLARNYGQIEALKAEVHRQLAHA